MLLLTVLTTSCKKYKVKQNEETTMEEHTLKTKAIVLIPTFILT
jgi:hypothetical protein